MTRLIIIILWVFTNLFFLSSLSDIISHQGLVNKVGENHDYNKEFLVKEIPSHVFYSSLIQIILASSLEAVTVIFLVSWIKKLKSKLLRFLLLFITILATIFYLLFLYFSFRHYQHRGSFLSYHDWVFIYYVTDWQQFKTLITSADVQAIAAKMKPMVTVLVFVYGLARIFKKYRAKSNQENTKVITLYPISLKALILILGISAIAATQKLTFSSKDYNKTVILLENYLAPQGAYLKKIFYEDIYNSHQKDLAGLKELSETKDQYLKLPSNSYQQKNVILIVVESLRQDNLNHHENSKPITPFLNSMAQKGVSFNNAYSASTETAYSLASIITSLYPLKFNHRDLNQNLKYPKLKIYDVFYDLGYSTAYFGIEWSISKLLSTSKKLELHYNPQDIKQTNAPISDFSCLTGCQVEIDKLNIAKFKEWKSSQTKQKKPFFSMFYLYSSHFPYYKDEKFVGIFPPVGLPKDFTFYYYSPENFDLMEKRYFNSINYADFQIMEIYKTLSEEEKKDTMIIVTGDHGEFFHEHGKITHAAEVYQEAVRVPLIFFNAGEVELSYLAEEAVSHVDIAPTILNVLGLPPSDLFQGVPLLETEKSYVKNKLPENSSQKNSSQKKKPPIFISTQTTIFEDAAISYPWKIIRNSRTGRIQIFNLDLDPKESTNLYLEDLQTGDKNQEISSTSKISTENQPVLLNLINNFRNRQLSYYDNITNCLDTSVLDLNDILASCSKITEGSCKCFFPPRYESVILK